MKDELGFTLIELLAVITIMGILMMVAIPSVSRVIENTRRDTFLDNAKVYINAVRQAVISDELICNGVTVSAIVVNTTYHFNISTDPTSPYYQQTMDLMETPALSSWGNNNVSGSIIWTKIRGGEATRTKYSILLVDTANHGFTRYVPETDLTRSEVKTSGALLYTPVGTECTLK